MTRLHVFLFCALLAVAPDLALAQDGEVVSSSTWDLVLGILVPLLGVVGGASVVSAFVSSDHPWMKLVDAVAFNWLKARNDSSVQ